MKKYQPQKSGFTLLELIIVVAGLGALSSFAVSNVNKYISYSQEDQASSTLNAVAADCLQKLRRQGNANSKIDENIMSYQKLQSFGYEFHNEKTETTIPSCRSVSIGRPPSDNSTSPVIGFDINDIPGDEFGKLTKRATDEGDEKAAARWAGSNIQSNAEVEAWRELNEAISAAKEACLNGVNDWLAAGGSGSKNTWNDTRTSTCTASPPAAPDDKTCSSGGCDGSVTVWALDGQICGYTAEEYEECVAREKGLACAAALEEIRKKGDTTKDADGDEVNDCEGERFWFFEGEDTGSKDEWSAKMCTANKEELLDTLHSDPVDHCGDSPIYICGGEELTGSNAKADFEQCLANNKDAQCTQALNDDAVTRGSGGAYTSPTPEGMEAPVGEDCGEQYYYCEASKKIYKGSDAEERFDADEECQIVIGGPGCIPVNQYYCNILPGSEFCECQN